MRARASAAAAAVVVSLLMASACGDDDGAADVAPSSSVAATARNRSWVTTTTISMESVVSVNVQPGASTGFEDGEKDVRGMLCTFADGVWNASGAVLNPTDAIVDYRIYLTFIDAPGNFRGLLEVNVAGVDPQERVEWRDHLTLLDPAVTCMLRVERTARSS